MRAPPLVTAVLGGSIVEIALGLAIQARLRADDEELWVNLTNAYGAMSSFSQKIWVGYALNIYSIRTRENLLQIKRIRNEFAHSTRLIDFADKTIKTALRQITTDTDDQDSGMKQDIESQDVSAETLRLAFAIYCRELAADMQIAADEDKTKQLLAERDTLLNELDRMMIRNPLASPK